MSLLLIVCLRRTIGSDVSCLGASLRFKAKRDMWQEVAHVALLLPLLDQSLRKLERVALSTEKYASSKSKEQNKYEYS